MTAKIDRKLIRRLKRWMRVKMTSMVRADDLTAAYYCEETDEIILFVDVIVSDAMVHFKRWGNVISVTLEEFVLHFIGTRTPLHELMHYCEIADSKLCEYIAIKFTWGNENLACLVTDWLYGKKDELVKIPEIWLE